MSSDNNKLKKNSSIINEASTDREFLAQMDLILSEEKEDTRHTPLSISNYALQKALCYAKVNCLLSNQHGLNSDWECYGYLLRDEWSLDDTVSDICFAQDQHPQSAYVQVSASGVAETAARVLALGYVIVGWWHSHGNLPVFHSSTDRHNFETIVHSVAPTTMYKVQKINPHLENGYAYFGNTRIQTDRNLQEVLMRTTRDPFGYSLVVNKHGKKYIERQEKDFKTGQIKASTIVGIESISDERLFSISDIERDVRTVLSMRPESSSCHTLHVARNDTVIPFIQNAYALSQSDTYGVAAYFLRSLTTEPLSTLFTTTFDRASTLSIPIDETSDINLTSARSELERMLTLTSLSQTTVRDAHDMQALLLHKFVLKQDFSNIELYAKAAKNYNDAHERARDLTRALCTYAMLPHISGKSIPKAQRINHFLTTLNTPNLVPCLSEKSALEGKSQNIFLYHDRARIYRQFYAATTRMINSGIEDPFLSSLLAFSRNVILDKENMQVLYHDTLR